MCPACGHADVQTGAAHKSMPFRCRKQRNARKRFSVKTGTAIQSSNLGYQTWAIAMYLVLTSIKGVSSMRLRRDLKITQKSVWHLAHRIRMAFHMLGQQVRQGCAVVGLAAARTPPTALGHVPP